MYTTRSTQQNVKLTHSMQGVFDRTRQEIKEHGKGEAEEMRAKRQWVHTG